MLARVCLLVVVLTSLVALTPIAFAYPPDPLWIPGIYDDDDNDDIINMVTSASHAVSVWCVDATQPLLIVVARLLPQELTGATATIRNASQSRAPPTA